MKTILICDMAVLGFISIAQEAKPKTEKPKPTQEELEARFKTALTKATFNGRWCAIEEGRLGQEKKDRYVINGVTKIGTDLWIINARIQYGGKDIVAPIPVQVKWAGDTAVIILDKVPVPDGGSSYSARVLIHENTYAGTWSADDHGGLISGVITNAKE